ncbi:MAG TPA: hypothetical protein VKG38_09650, partial [Solirubrobacteraceae bacterium]|nr:hypothetical protein [Solirubrobacteraceae bacterium]
MIAILMLVFFGSRRAADQQWWTGPLAGRSVPISTLSLCAVAGRGSHLDRSVEHLYSFSRSTVQLPLDLSDDRRSTT